MGDGRAQQLFEDYNQWRDHTNHVQQMRQRHPMQRLKAKPDRLQIFEQLITWCDGQGIPPRLWLYSLFQTRRWLFAPPLKHLLSTKNHLPRYKELSNTQAYQDILRTERKVEVTYDPNRDTSGTTEALKRRYLARGDAAGCMAAVDATLGYHPKSDVCVPCACAVACEKKLVASAPFDIMALRRGELASTEAKKQAQFAYAYGSR